MRFATTILLTLVAVGLGLYAFLDHSGVIRQIAGDPPTPELSAPVLEAITSFSIERGEETVSLEKVEDVWRLTTPVDDLADPIWVQSTLETFASLRSKDYLPDPSGGQRSNYGLAEETASTLRIGLSDGKKLVYQLGDKGPFQNSTYLSPGTAEDYVGAFAVAGDFAAIAAAPVGEIIDPTLTRFDAEKIVGLTFQQQDQVIDLKRHSTPGSRWRLEAPLQHQADDDQVNQLLTSIATLKMQDVVLSGPAATPDQDPDATASAETRVIQIWDPTPKNVIQLTFKPAPSADDLLVVEHSKRSLQYLVPRPALESCFPTAAEPLRESRILRIDAADISSITFRPQAGAPLVVENSGAWLVRTAEDDLQLANPDQGERLVNLFNETLVTQYLAAGADKLALYGLDAPQFSVDIEGENLGPLQSESLTMFVGLPPGNPPNAYVTFKDADFIAAVSKTFLTSIAQATNLLRWKKLEVLNIAFDRIQEVRLQTLETDPMVLEVNYEAETPEENLKLRIGDRDRSSDMDRHAAAQIVMEAGHFSPDKWMPITPESSQALTDPTLELTITAKPEEGDEPKVATLHFGPVNAEVPTFYYGQLQGTEKPEPFLIDKAFYDRLTGKGLLLETP